ncbi:hypothetical protein CLU79DRAFT_298769 [Phycomyces nitens]|nr:hypothetical protein CLU79DRAFT_298769 [Phycomyces nitens]
MFCIAGMGLQERLALKAAVNFMAEFVGQDYEEGTGIGAIIHTLVTNMGPQIIEKLLIIILWASCRCLVQDDYKIHPGLQRMASYLTPSYAEKIAFIKGIIGTRSLKRFKDVVNAFSVKCRGLSNTSFGAV